MIEPSSLTTAVEVWLIAYKGALGNASQEFNSTGTLFNATMSSLPPKRWLSKNALSKEIGMHKKPDYLASKILKMFAKRDHQWIVVGGFEANGDVRGAINAGLNVAIERP